MTTKSSLQKNLQTFAGISTIEKIIRETEYIAQVHQDKEERKRRQKERKNQARRMQIS